MAGGQILQFKGDKMVPLTKKPKKTNTERISDLENDRKKQEVKFISEDANEISMTQGGTALNYVALINDMSQGVGANQMTGLQVQQRSIGFRYLLHNVNTTPALIRVFLIKTSVGVVLDTTGNQLLRNADGTGRDFDASNDRQQLYLRSNHGRYTIIYDKVIKLSGRGVDGNSNKIINFNKTYKNTKRTYNQDGTPNEKFYIAMRVLDPAMDYNSTVVEATGSAYFTYKDN